MLGSANRSSFIAPPLPPPPPSTHQRSVSLGFTPAIKPRPAKRLSHVVPASLPVLPYTPAEWKRAIAEIKRHHFSKRHRACTARCTEILDNIKQTEQVEPVYIINLHFYAATSMELCARMLPSTSPSRANLLRQARKHFDRAAALVDAAEQSVITRTRANSAMSLRSSSCHSPTGSISSRAATPETRLTSPTDSICSFDDLAAKPQTPQPTTSCGKRVKKVSFSLPQEIPLRIPEPIVRPDSPTLGFDDEYFHSGAARQDLPELPKPLKFEEVELPLQTVSETEQLQLIPEDDAFLIARSVDRYCENLSGLREQLSRHSANVHELLASPIKAQPSPRCSIISSHSRQSSEGDAQRKLDLYGRIERLRQNGWQRKRFDARRYEELCNAALSELA